jgi:hypothetical protein
MGAGRKAAKSINEYLKTSESKDAADESLGAQSSLVPNLQE